MPNKEEQLSGEIKENSFFKEDSSSNNEIFKTYVEDFMGEDGRLKLLQTKKTIKKIEDIDYRMMNLNLEIEKDFKSGILDEDNDSLKNFKYEQQKFSIIQKPLYAIPKLRKTITVYDSLSEDEVEITRPLIVNFQDINHTSMNYSKILAYYFIKNLIIMIIVIMNPLSIGFNPFVKDWHGAYHSFTKLITILIEIYLLVDFILGAFVAFDSTEGIVIKTKVLKLLFTRKELITDTLIAFPSNILFQIYENIAGNNPEVQSTVLILSHLRWLKCLGIFKIDKIIKIANFVFDVNHIISIITSSLFYVLYFHVATCLWIYIGKIELALNSKNWINFYSSSDDDWTGIYVLSLYYNFATLFTVGYGDVRSVTITEFEFTCCLLVISYLVFTIIFSSVSSYFNKYEVNHQMLEKKKYILSEIAEEHPMPNKLKLKIISFISNSINISQEQKNHLLEHLPHKLKYELLSKIYKEAIQNLFFFRETPEEFNYFLVSLLKPLNLDKGEILLTIGDMYHDIYFVIDGKLDFFLLEKEKSKKFFSVSKGDNFGEIGVLENQSIDYEIASSIKCDSELLLLSKEDLNIVKANYPELLKEKMNHSIEKYEKMETKKKLIFDKWSWKLNNSTFFQTIGDTSQPTLKKVNTYKGDVAKVSQSNLIVNRRKVVKMIIPQKNLKPKDQLKNGISELKTINGELKNLNTKKKIMNKKLVCFGLKEKKIPKLSEKTRKVIHIQKVTGNHPLKYEADNLQFQTVARVNPSFSNNIRIKVKKLFKEDFCSLAQYSEAINSVFTNYDGSQDISPNNCYSYSDFAYSPKTVLNICKPSKSVPPNKSKQLSECFILTNLKEKSGQKSKRSIKSQINKTKRASTEATNPISFISPIRLHRHSTVLSRLTPLREMTIAMNNQRKSLGVSPFKDKAYYSHLAMSTLKTLDNFNNTSNSLINLSLQKYKEVDKVKLLNKESSANEETRAGKDYRKRNSYYIESLLDEYDLKKHYERNIEPLQDYLKDFLIGSLAKGETEDYKNY